MHADFSPTVYILASQRNGTLYTGVTSNLLARIHQHRAGAVRGFTRDYGVKLLAAPDDGVRNHSREADQEMEPRVEAGTDRS